MSANRPAPSARSPLRFDLLQVAAVVVAVYLLVLGIVAVARGGFFTDGVTSPVVEVGAITATPILGLGLVLAGLALLWSSGGIEIDDVSIRVVAGLILVLGIVLVIEPGAFQDVLGSERNDGWHHLVVGGLLMVVSFLPPSPVGPRTPAPPPPADDRTRRLDDPGAPPRDDDPTERIR